MREDKRSDTIPNSPRVWIIILRLFQKVFHQSNQSSLNHSLQNSIKNTIRMRRTRPREKTPCPELPTRPSKQPPHHRPHHAPCSADHPACPIKRSNRVYASLLVLSKNIQLSPFIHPPNPKQTNPSIPPSDLDTSYSIDIIASIDLPPKLPDTSD